ncbi:hypothetical protein TNCV_659811 [Trichonephila clavipes]|nr:hypothetical protein TNCV_659811 [Trichonephila clavipes]
MSAVSIKIPPFWTDRPEIWFYQVEAQFQISRISLEETKFHYLVSQLEPKYVENIWDIVNSKSDTKYTDSKNRLLSLFKESENLRIKRLLTGIELRDMKPSQLLQKLKTVATSDISDNLIKTLWLEKLPESIKNILVVSDENLSKLAVMADKISDMTPRTEIFATGKSLDCEDYKACRKFRLFVKDRTTNLHFLVDSGADCSIIPATSKNKQPSDYKLFAANGTEIPTYGIKVLNIDLGLRREFLFPFIIAKVSKGILGADFLNKFNLLIDIRNKQLIDGITNLHVTDHKPITYAFHQKNEKASPRQLRHLQYISQFSTNICHIKGQDNLVADAFSRIEAITVIDYDTIADKQTQDAELQQLMRSNSSVKFKSCTLPSGKTLWCDISTSNIRPYIPKQFRQQIFQQIHGFSHPGIRSTIKLMTEKFIWPNMKQEIREWARTCIPCQKCKVHRHTKSKFGEYEVPDTRFSVIHIDLIGPLPPSQGMTFCMTCIDRFSCWMEAVPLPDCKAETASKAFYEHWVCRFGVPGKIVTDQGRQFESQLFRSLAAICGAKVAHATSYHPQCNGKVERLHRTLKRAIKAHNNIKWTETLPTILLGLRTALRPDTNHTIAQMVYGSNIRLPGEFFNPPSIQIDPETFVTTLQTFMDDLKPTKSFASKKSKDFCS